MERNNILVTERKKSDFTNKDILQDVTRLIKFKKGENENASNLPQMELVHATSALSPVIKYLEVIKNDYRLICHSHYSMISINFLLSFTTPFHRFVMRRVKLLNPWIYFSFTVI